ncbi:uncharacterized protein METZ01_LOCUS392147 [marine metagenome]|uniref:Uncharacterized protein n=1 Tax=marine metagenome TaxID=408172 RepID=A0A382UYG6_9ZZZZ
MPLTRDYFWRKTMAKALGQVGTISISIYFDIDLIMA